MTKNSDSDKPSTLSAIVGWCLTLGAGGLISVPFISGYAMNNTYFDANGQAVFDTASLVGPGIGGGVLFAFVASDITFKFVGKAYRSFKGATSYAPSSPDVLAAQWAEDAWESTTQPLSRSQIKEHEQREAEVRAKGWEDLDAHHNALVLEWSKYETDIALMIDYPIMTDYTDPVVHKVIAAMQKIRTAQMRGEDRGAIDAPDSILHEAVNDFELAFRAAERYARRQGQTHLDPREQRKLSAARTALNIILDGDSPAFEVEAAYKSLRSSLKGIIDVPDRAIAEIEAKVRREIIATAPQQA